MFKNVMVYRIGPDWSATVEQMEEALAKMPFEPCGATQEISMGWVPPRGNQHGALVELAGGHRILRFVDGRIGGEEPTILVQRAATPE